MTMTSLAADAVGGYRLDLARGVTEVDRDEWNAVVLGAGGSVFHAWEWLAAFEEAPPGDFEAAHLLAYAGGQLVGICPAYLARSCPRLDYLWSLAGISPGGPILLAHSLAAFAGGPLALADHQDVVGLLVNRMQTSADQLGAWAWGFANLPAGPLTGRLLSTGHAVAQVTTAHRLETAYATEQEYWATIPSKRRRKLQRERRVRLEHATVDDGVPDIDVLVRLVHALLDDRNTPIDVLPESFLASLRRHLAPYERSVVATDNSGDTVAMFAGWQFGPEWSVWIAGLDTAKLNSFDPYHPMLAHTIESAVRTGTAVVNFGRANALQKRRYGAEGVPLFLTLHSPDRQRNAILHAACRKIEESVREVRDGLDVVRRCC
ncbi:GNAT family N-acetyltransferase [Kutzneria sp. NPDC051319]|uniref:GNAT family N-acetyltransferase n=1 Tax=Kutzneria sp. NPDC051319 TaxID=3155047 RepID=UPI003440E8F8